MTRRVLGALVVFVWIASSRWAGASPASYSTDPTFTTPPPANLAPGEVITGLNPLTIEWKWPTPGSTPAGPWKSGFPNQKFSLGPGRSFYLGLDNLYLGEDWTKRLTLSFTYKLTEGHGTYPTISETHGYSNDSSRHGHLKSTSPSVNPPQVTDPDGTVHISFSWDIKPQPDWEYVRISNTSLDAEAFMKDISNISLTANCTPEPATLGLLALGGLAMLRRRRQ